MKNQKHTPGPWRIKRSTDFVENQITEYLWVGAGQMGDEHPVSCKVKNPKDASLIASAPEMYALLQVIEKLIERDATGGDRCDSITVASGVLADIYNVLRKAGAEE